MNPIGGFFELETGVRKKHYHKDALHLNTARNAFEYVLRAYNIKKVLLPVYLCEALLEPLNRSNIDYDFYGINKNLEPVFKFERIKKEEAFLYINYFGVMDYFIKMKAPDITNFIVDNSQAFYSMPVKKSIATFYSARKFFGVADGAYLYTGKRIDSVPDIDESYSRMLHLLKRVDCGPANSYVDFIRNEKVLSGQPVKIMSNLTSKILCSTPYERYRKQRMKNFIQMHNSLVKYNELRIDENAIAPLCYPFLVENGNRLRRILIENNVFIPTYWPDILKKSKKHEYEYYLADNLVALPVDQRYKSDDIKKVLTIILKSLL